MKKLNSLTELKFTLRVSSCFLFCVLLQACQTMPAYPDPSPEPNVPVVSKQALRNVTPLICDNASRFEHKVIGNGHCVSLIRICSNAPTTRHWRAGDRVTNSSPKAGTVIATFANGEYPNRKGYHAAIFISQDRNGIWVWDQWKGKAVHKRLIRFGSKRTEASNSAQAYRAVILNQSSSRNRK